MKKHKIHEKTQKNMKNQAPGNLATEPEEAFSPEARGTLGPNILIDPHVAGGQRACLSVSKGSFSEVHPT